MLSQAMQNAVNDQINNELYSSYSYLSMSAYCEHVGANRHLGPKSGETNR